jgi:hypothetical protein
MDRADRGDKWAVLILLLVRDEPKRFNALRRTIEGISQKMLSQCVEVAGLNAQRRYGVQHKAIAA